MPMSIEERERIPTALSKLGFEYKSHYSCPGDDDPDNYWEHSSGVVVYYGDPRIENFYPTAETIAIYNKVCDLLDFPDRKIDLQDPILITL